MNRIRFRLFGVPVVVEPFFFLLIGLIGLQDDLGALLAWIGIASASVLLHEGGHAIAYRAFGFAPSIRLHGFGGLTSASVGEDFQQRFVRRMVVAAAGPAIGLVIGIPAFVAWRNGSAALPEHILVDLWWANLGWGVLNLLPIQPLDGGKIFGAFADSIFRRHGPAVTAVVSLVAGGAIALWAFAIGELFIGLLAAFLGLQSLRPLTAGREQDAAARLAEGYRALNASDLATARAVAEEVQAMPRSGRAKIGARELLAWTELLQGRPEQAATLAGKPLPGFQPNPYLLACIDVASGRTVAGIERLAGTSWQHLPTAQIVTVLANGRATGEALERMAQIGDPARRSRALMTLPLLATLTNRHELAASLGAAAFAHLPDPFLAYNTACALSRGGRTTEALEWLVRAIDAGFDQLAMLDEDEDLANARDDPGFARVRARLV
ncbi:MAG TPA: site-2 protease family protein [Actinomycetota bacterium]